MFFFGIFCAISIGGIKFSRYRSVRKFRSKRTVVTPFIIKHAIIVRTEQQLGLRFNINVQLDQNLQTISECIHSGLGQLKYKIINHSSFHLDQLKKHVLF